MRKIFLSMKDRLTLLSGANSNGYMKLKLLLVYHSESPITLKYMYIIKERLPVIQRLNKRAQATQALFENGWLSRQASEGFLDSYKNAYNIRVNLNFLSQFGVKISFMSSILDIS